MATFTDETGSAPLSDQTGSAPLFTEGGSGSVSLTGVAAAVTVAGGSGSLTPPGTLVQAAAPTFNTQSISFGSNITPGNSVIVCMSRPNAIAAPITITGNSQTLTQAEISTNGFTWIYYKSAVGASPGATISGASGNAVLYAYEIAGPITLDKIATASTNGGSTTSTFTVSTATTTSSRQIWVGVTYAISGPSSIAGPATPWVNEPTEANACVSGYEFTSAAGVCTYSGTFGSNSTYEVCAATFTLANPSAAVTGVAASLTVTGGGGTVNTAANPAGIASPVIVQGGGGTVSLGQNLTGASAAQVTTTGGGGSAFAASASSPALEVFGFAFPSIPAGSTVNVVVASIGQFGSDAGIGAPVYELWDGTSARIGSPVYGHQSQNSAWIDEVRFTGVSYSQLATLRLRIYAQSSAGNSGAAESVDWAELTIGYTPPASVTGVSAQVSVAGGTGTVTTGTEASAAQISVRGGGGTVFAGSTVVHITGVSAQVSVQGGTGTPSTGQNLTGASAAVTATGGGGSVLTTSASSYASTQRVIAGGIGTWTNPANADGPPDGSDATWTVP